MLEKSHVKLPFEPRFCSIVSEAPQTGIYLLWYSSSVSKKQNDVVFGRQNGANLTRSNFNDGLVLHFINSSPNELFKHPTIFFSNFMFENVRFKNGQAAGSISEIYLGLSAAFRQNARPQKMHLQKGSASSGANNSL